MEWTSVGQLLTLAASRDLGPSRVVKRPKVVYNNATAKFAMYMHIDSSNYGEAKVGVATGVSVCDAYTYQGSFQPMDHESRDIGMYKGLLPIATDFPPGLGTVLADGSGRV